MTTAERWVPCPTAPEHYEVSDAGRVRRVRTQGGRPCQRVLSQSVKTGGYIQVCLCVGNRVKWHSVARLIARAFHGEPPTDEHQVNHIDGCKADNAAANLEWCTGLENVRHAFATGLSHGGVPPRYMGEGHPQSKLTETAVREIRWLVRRGGKHRDVGARYGVSKTQVANIHHGKQWAHVEGESAPASAEAA